MIIDGIEFTDRYNVVMKNE